jgi:hypothetical protein
MFLKYLRVVADEEGYEVAQAIKGPRYFLRGVPLPNPNTFLLA